MKRGPLHQLHARGGASFVERDGWELPADFGSPEAELAALKEGVGLADLSGWGVLRLRGRNRQDFVQRMSTNNVMGLAPGQGAPTIFTTPIGRIVDLAYVLVGQEDVLLFVGRGAGEVVAAWLRRHIFFNDDVVVEDMTEQWGLMGLVGPGGAGVMAKLLDEGALELAPHHAHTGRIAGVEVTVIRAVPLGNGCLLVTTAGQAPALWSALASVGGRPVGETALETARIGAGLPRFGRELSEDYIPLEAGLKWAVSFNKGCYVGQEIIARMETYGKLAKRLVVLGIEAEAGSGDLGLVVDDEVWADGARVGQVTSVAPLADAGMVRALAYVKTAAAGAGRELRVAGRDVQREAKVLALSGEGPE